MLWWHRYRLDTYWKQREGGNVPSFSRFRLTTNHSNTVITIKPRITPGSHILCFEETRKEKPTISGNYTSSLDRKYLFGCRLLLPRNYKENIIYYVDWSHALKSIFDVSFCSPLCVLLRKEPIKSKLQHRPHPVKPWAFDYFLCPRSWEYDG